MDASQPGEGRAARIRARLSYANVMATVAVFIALGGGAYAVSIGKGDVGAREIDKNAVGSPELKNDKTKGKDVDESSLGKVPSAVHADTADIADTATTASNSTKVGGLTVRKFNARQQVGEPLETVLSLGGLTLQMSCPAQGNLVATTSKDDSSLFVWGIYTDVNSISSADQEGQDFELGETFDVAANIGGGGFDPNLGSLLYENADGTVVTVDLVVDNNVGPGGDGDCGVAGTAVGG